jgi:uridine kinase
MSTAERDRQNFDHPDSLDHELFLADLDSLISRKTVQEPIYDFATHDRLAQSREVRPADLVLVDGILLFSWPQVLSRLDLSIFVDADEDTRLARRLARDVVERGRTESSVRDQFVETVVPMHARFVQPSSARADRLVRGDGDIEALSAMLATDLLRLLSE